MPYKVADAFWKVPSSAFMDKERRAQPIADAERSPKPGEDGNTLPFPLDWRMRDLKKIWLERNSEQSIRVDTEIVLP